MKLKNKSIFSTGDLVAVFGGEIGKEGKSADEIDICKVVVVGERDLIVESASQRFIRSHHVTVPQNICSKLKLDPDTLSKNKTLDPKIGDLVMSYVKDSFKDEDAEQITGILYKINYRFGKPSKCSLLLGNESKEVSYDSLLVLQSKNKN